MRLLLCIHLSLRIPWNDYGRAWFSDGPSSQCRQGGAGSAEPHWKPDLKSRHALLAPSALSVPECQLCSSCIENKREGAGMRGLNSLGMTGLIDSSMGRSKSHLNHGSLSSDFHRRGIRHCVCNQCNISTLSTNRIRKLDPASLPPTLSPAGL